MAYIWIIPGLRDDHSLTNVCILLEIIYLINNAKQDVYFNFIEVLFSCFLFFHSVFLATFRCAHLKNSSSLRQVAVQVSFTGDC